MTLHMYHSAYWGRAMCRWPAYVLGDWSGEKSPAKHQLGVGAEYRSCYVLSHVLCRVYED